MKIIVLGGGICGLGSAIMLARAGHEVTVIERDAAPPPDTPQEAWEAWERKGVVQFRQPHNFMPGLRLLLEAEMPDVQEALVAAGAGRFDLVNPLPPFLQDQSPRPVDEQLWTYTARRPAGEWAFASVARNEPRVTILRGRQAAGLLAGAATGQGVPHVVGIEMSDGEKLHADLVVDAMGRRSKSPDWLAAIGARRPYEEEEDCGFTYYTRYFRGDEPQRAGPVLMPMGTISLLTIPGDNGTWSVTIFTATGDAPLKELRHTDKWSTVVRACPMQAHWLDGEPITDVLAMSGMVDRYRRFVVDGEPVATGFVAVADAWACTNPSAGRGLTVGFLHAQRLRDVLRDEHDPLALAHTFDEITEAELSPWYRAQIVTDRARFAQIEALCEGRAPAPPDDELARSIVTLLTVMAMDPDLLRAGLEYVGTIRPVQEVLARPEVATKLQVMAAAMQNAPPPSPPGPNREQLLALLG